MKRNKLHTKFYICLLLVLALLSGCAANWQAPGLEPAPGPEILPGASESVLPTESLPPAESAPAMPKGTAALRTAPLLAYVPLDDRGVNTQRIAYLTASYGYELYMPDAADYATLLDGQPLDWGSSGTEHGNRTALLDWLRGMEAQGCNNYILSLDQLMSGGLAASRYLTMEEDGEFGLNSVESDGLYSEVLDFLTGLAENPENRVYILDTVMRLCLTDCYGGCDTAVYEALRTYGKLERPALAPDSTPDQIAESYPLTPDGPALAELQPETAALLTQTRLQGLSPLERFHSARLRKLYLFRDTAAALQDFENVCFFIGVDDSGTEKNIQTGDIAYVKRCLSQCAGESFVYDGADELGMCAAARLYAERSGCLGAAKISVEYFGGGEDQILSQFDSKPLEENIRAHAESLGAEIDPEGELSLLVLTGANGSLAWNCRKLRERLEENVQQQVPTILLDASKGNDGQKLLEQLLDSGCMSKVMGFSRYNTLGNSIGLALSIGFSRYCYLSRAEDRDSTCDQAHLCSLTLAYLKEFIYKDNVQVEIIQAAAEQGLNPEDFYAQGAQPDMKGLERRLRAAMESEGAALLEALNTGAVITGLSPYREENLGRLSISDYSFPWHRAFEIDFQITLEQGA